MFMIIVTDSNINEICLCRQEYLEWLKSTWQESTAAEVYQRMGDYPSAVNMFLKAGLPSKAAKYFSIDFFIHML